MMTIIEVLEPNLCYFTNMQILEPTYGYTMENFTLKGVQVEIEDSIHKIDCCVQRTMDKLKASKSLGVKALYDLIVTSIASVSLQLVSGTATVVAERTSTNAAAQELPLCLPVDFCNMTPRDFSAGLNHQNIRLKHLFTNDQIMAMDQQYCDLCVLCRE
jgi:hypothetical protein